MTKSKFLKNTGLVVGGVALLSFVDFLNARVLAPFSPFYKERGAVQTAEPELPPLDLSKMKVTDTNKILEQREALSKKSKLEQRVLVENDAMAMMEIGLMYEGTALGEADIPQAIYWFKKAADTGNPQAEKHLKTLNIINMFSNLAEIQSNEQTLSLDTSKGLTLKNSKGGDKNTAPPVSNKPAAPAMTRQQISARIAEITKQVPSMSGDDLDAVMDELDELETALYATVGLKKPEATAISNEKSTFIGPKKLTQAAIQGDANAQSKLGNLYYIGSGVEKNARTAFDWRLKAANQGHADAQYQIALAYSAGNVVERNSTKSTNWYERSAKSGSTRGQLAYGEALMYGDGVSEDYAKAVSWLEKAFENGGSYQRFSAALYLYKIYYEGGNQVTQSYEQAFKWASTLPEVDSVGTSFFYLGRHYENGQGVKQDYAKAKLHYEKANELNYNYGQYALATMYLEGKGIKPDREKAISLLRTAAKNHSYEAGVKLKELGVTVE